MIWIIAHNESRRTFFSLLFWCALSVASFFAAALFYALLNAWMNDPEQRLGSSLSETVVADFLQFASLILLVLSPLLTMRLFSEERQRGTLYLALSSPVSATQLVLGKFLGGLIPVTVLVCLLVALPVLLLPLATLDPGQLITGWTGLFLTACSFVATGLFISSLCATQASAALGTFAVLILLWIIGLSGADNNDFFLWMSWLEHYSHFRKGLLHSTDLSYYLLLCLATILLCIWRQDLPRLSGQGSTLLRLHSFATFGLISVLLGLLAWASTQYSVQYDWTRQGRHRLSTSSQAVLSQLHGEVEVTAYARNDPGLRGQITDFLMRYQRHKKDLPLHFTNPDLAPDAVRIRGIRKDGELLLRYQNRTERVRKLDEQSFTNALFRLTREKTHWLAFIEGHGERGALEKSGQDFSQWAQYLDAQGFRIQPLSLAKTGTVPDNVSVLIISNPRTAYRQAELDELYRYIDRGGNLLWLTDPGTLHGLENLAAMLGITLEDGAIIDPRSKHPLIITFSPQQYGAFLAEEQAQYGTAVLAGSRSILGSQTEAQGGWQATPLLSTTAHSWNETGHLASARFDPATDRHGPLQTGITLRRRKSAASGLVTTRLSMQEQRIVIIGDGDFLSNRYLGRSGNLEIGMRAIHWLSFENPPPHIPARVTPDSTTHLPGRALRLGGIFFLFILPALAVSCGILIRYYRRREPA